MFLIDIKLNYQLKNVFESVYLFIYFLKWSPASMHMTFFLPKTTESFIFGVHSTQKKLLLVFLNQQVMAIKNKLFFFFCSLFYFFIFIYFIFIDCSTRLFMTKLCGFVNPKTFPLAPRGEVVMLTTPFESETDTKVVVVIFFEFYGNFYFGFF